MKVVGVSALAISIWYLQWVFGRLNDQAIVLSVAYAISCIILFANTLLAVVNSWNLRLPAKKLHKVEDYKKVAVIIPTWGEPVDMIKKTAVSVLNQNWPHKKILLVIGDDARRADVKAMTLSLQKQFRKAEIVYHMPPAKHSPRRRGEAKSGNLNSALRYILRYHPDIEFIETRDADDVVVQKNFLRYCVTNLLKDPSAAFVQTIKESVVSPGDPFGNQEYIFYKRSMLAKHSTNAVFPCGSGLVWRTKELVRIGGFPTWNLVEDLHSGYEILQKGGKGIYLPIVGARGQTAPEDIPNFYKQRGTWALDTMRLFFWKNPLFAPKLNILQKLQFMELGFFYMLGFTNIVFIISIISSLVFDIYPIKTSVIDYTLHFWPYFVITELLLVVKSIGLPFEAIWRSKQIWFGLAPVYVKAIFLALFYGSEKKPSYKVTRKDQVVNWYWKETLIQGLMLVGLALSIVIHLASAVSIVDIDFGSIFWAIFFILLMSRVVRNSWFGMSLKQILNTEFTLPRYQDEFVWIPSRK